MSANRPALEAQIEDKALKTAAIDDALQAVYTFDTTALQLPSTTELLRLPPAVWHVLSDPVMEDSLYDVVSIRRIAGLDQGVPADMKSIIVITLDEETVEQLDSWDLCCPMGFI